MSSRTPSPKHLETSMSLAARIKDSLTNPDGKLDVDTEEFLLVVETDTDVMAILDRLEENVSMAKDYADRARNRATALEKRAAGGRRVMQAILEALETRKIERPTYTASLRRLASTLVLEDEKAIPFEFLVMSPDKPAITKALKAGDTVDGVRLSDPRDALYITRGRAAPEETSNE